MTRFQGRVIGLLAKNRAPDNHLAGGAALHLSPNSKRYSNDLDFFQDSVERVAQAYEEDAALLIAEGYGVTVDMKQPGYIRARVSLGDDATKVEWTHDSAWRFLPTLDDPICGFKLHPLDLAINKLLALVGRDEPRDFLDVMIVHDDVLPLGALVWAAVGKDPGFTPLSLIGLLRRRGKYRQEDFQRLHLSSPVDLPALKERWMTAVDEAEAFVRGRPADEIGCLYFDPASQSFVCPGPGDRVVPHYGRPAGILPSGAR